jgi:hypothetical protein
MTSGESPSGPSAAKLGGFALIGVGAVAGVLGVVTVMTGATHHAADSAGQAAMPNTPPPPPPMVSSPLAAPGEPRPGPPASQQQAPVVPGGVPNSNGAGQAAPRIVVRVYNNSTITGLAHRAADDFVRAGYDVPEVGNYPSGVIYTTTVYYRPGTDEEAQARQLAAAFGARVEPRFPGIDSASPGVIAIITNDYKGPQAGK